MMPTLIRIKKRRQFVVVEKGVAEDSRLSWAARGILIYLLAKPDDWKVMRQDLINRGDLGRDGVYSKLNELIRLGYITRSSVRNKKGQIIGSEYLVYEEPRTGNTDAVEQLPDIPVTGVQGAAKKTLLNNNITKDTLKRETTTIDVRDLESSLIFENIFEGCDRTEIISYFQGVPVNDAQQILDEVFGRSKNVNIDNVLGYTRTLADIYKSGGFVPELAQEVARQRKHRQRVLDAVEKSNQNHEKRLADYVAAQKKTKNG